MARPKKPADIDEAIERLQTKAIAAAAKAKPTKRASKELLDILHHVTCLQLVKAMTEEDAVPGQALSAAQRYLQNNNTRREPGDSYDEDEGGNYAGASDYGPLPYGDDPSDDEINILKD